MISGHLEVSILAFYWKNDNMYEVVYRHFVQF